MDTVLVIGLIVVAVLGLPFVVLVVWRRLTGYRRAYRRFERIYFPEGAPPILGRTAVNHNAAAAVR